MYEISAQGPPNEIQSSDEDLFSHIGVYMGNMFLSVYFN